MSAYIKDCFRLVKASFSRFIAIVLITALGVAFFAGLRSTGPHMREVAYDFFENQNFLDVKAVSTFGFDEDDIKAIASSEGIKEVHAAYSQDCLLMLGSMNVTSRIHSLPTAINGHKPINEPIIIEGRLPEKQGEIAADPEFMNSSGLKIGDKAVFTSGTSDSILESLATNTFTIVGTAKNPTYMTVYLGSNTVGSGKTQAYFYILASDFTYEFYTEAYAIVDRKAYEPRFSSSYDINVNDIIDRVKANGKKRSAERYEKIRSDARQELDDAIKEVNDGYKKLDDAQKKLDKAKEDLRKHWAEYYNGKREYDSKIASAKKAIASAKAQLESGWESFNAALGEFNTKIASSQKEIDDGYSQYNVALATVESGLKQIQDAISQAGGGTVQPPDSGGPSEPDPNEPGLPPNGGDPSEPANPQEPNPDPNEGGPSEPANPQEPNPDPNEGGPSEPANPKEPDPDPNEGGPSEPVILQGSPISTSPSKADQQQEAPADISAPADPQPEKPAELSAPQPTKEEAPKTPIEPEANRPQAETTEITSPQPTVEELISHKPLNAHMLMAMPLSSSQPQLPPELAAQLEELNSAKEKLDVTKGQLDSAQALLNASKSDGEKQLAESKKKLEDGGKVLADSQATLDKESASGKRELEDAYSKLVKGEEDYQKGLKDFKKEKKTALADLKDAEKEIADGEKDLSELKEPKWYVLGAKANAGYSGFKQDSNQIDAISKVIPLIFFLIAALVSMTSITRLVDSERTYIGTLKALGFGNFSIAIRYLAYALIASALGSALGTALGIRLFPELIYNAFQNLYTMPASRASFNTEFAALSTVSAILSATLPAVFVLLNTVRENPAELMRPIAPRPGQRTALESVTFLWKRLSFYSKASIRNMFRYKKRLAMTVFGIAGCTSLLFTGFALQDAITTVVSKQFGQLQRYSIQISYLSNASDEKLSEVRDELASNSLLESVSEFASEAAEVDSNGIMKTVYLIVPEEPLKVSSFFALRDRATGAGIPLDSSGIVVSEKLGRELGLQRGSQIKLRKSESGDEGIFTVAALTENYLNHYMYMTPEVYKKGFGQEPEATMALATLKGEDQSHNQGLLDSFLSLDGVSSVAFVDDLKDNMSDMVDALRYVMIVLIVSSAALCFVVLYSLITIAIEERKREIATIKVLGLFDSETAAYVLRENIPMIVLGIAFGLLMGFGLQRFVITTIEIDVLMFSRDILLHTYAYSISLTALFALLVNLYMYRDIAKIDMIASLKSVE